MQAVAITRGVSAAGGATDQCRDNLNSAWPLLREVGKSQVGLQMLSRSAKSCQDLQSPDDLPEWAQNPYFFMAEGNYPFPSTYITYSLLPGHPTPLPAWPMQVACNISGLNENFGINISGSLSEVNYTARLGALEVVVDWRNAKGNGATLTKAEIESSGVLKLAEAVALAAGVWYNLTGDEKCHHIGSESIMQAELTVSPKQYVFDEVKNISGGHMGSFVKNVETSSEKCPTCPPCDNCPPCPVSYCDLEDRAPCNYTQHLPKTFSWDAICCNEALSQIDIRGVGRDIFWPPQVPFRNYTVESIVGPHGLKPGGCAVQYAAEGLRGAPTISDPWSQWLESYYGGRNISHHRNIIWSNGALDPWSGQGVYPPGGGPEGPLVQHINEDGSQISLILDLGAHHLDLMFTDPRNPPCFYEARKIETKMIRQWCQEAYDAS
jgi:hypothetical protein